MLLVRTYNNEHLAVLCTVSMKSVDITSLSSNVEAKNDGYLSNVEDCKVSISVESPSN